MFRHSVIALTAVATGFALSAAEVRLIDGDPAHTSSFEYNNTNTTQQAQAQYGWDNHRDPSPDNDYVVGELNAPNNYKFTLRTPEANYSATTFKGKSLTLDNGTLYHAGQTTDGHVLVNDLRIKKGRLQNNSIVTWWDGTITFDGAAYGFPVGDIEIYTWMVKCHFNARMIASKRDNVRFTAGHDVVENKSKLPSYQRQVNANFGYMYYCTPFWYTYYLHGDCSGFYGTSYLDWGAALQLDCPIYGGSVNLSNLGVLQVSSNDTTCTYANVGVVEVGGSVTNRDGWVRLFNGGKLKIDGELNCGFAKPESYIIDSTNLYCGAGLGVHIDDEEYDFDPTTNFVPTCRSDTTLMRNGVSIGRFGSLEAGTATFDGTWITLERDTTFTVGVLKLNGGTIETLGKIYVNNAIKVDEPVKLVPPMTAHRTLVLTAPKGTVDATKFMLPDGYDKDRIALEVHETSDGRDALYIYNYSIVAESATTIYMMTSDQTASPKVSSYNTEGNWVWSTNTAEKVGFAPKVGYDYVVYSRKPTGPRAVALQVLQGNLGTFGGDSLSIFNCCSFRNDYSVEITVKDLRVFDSASTMNANQGDSSFTLNGQMRVFASREAPFEFYTQVQNGSTHTVNLNCKLIGGPTAGIKTSYAKERTATMANPNPGWVVMNLTGDCSEYYGNILVNTNGILHINTGVGLPNGIVELVNNATFDFTGTKEVKIGGFRYTEGSGDYTLNIPEDVTFSIGKIAVGGKLTVNTQKTFTIYGVAEPGIDSEVYCPSKSIGLYSKDAINGIVANFPNMTELHMPFVREDPEFAELGFYTTAAFAVEHDIEINIDVDAADIPRSKRASIPIMTIPSSTVAGIENRLILKSPWSGTSTKLVKVVNDRMTTLVMEVEPSGLSVRYY